MRTVMQTLPTAKSESEIKVDSISLYSPSEPANALTLRIFVMLFALSPINANIFDLNSSFSSRLLIQLGKLSSMRFAGNSYNAFSSKLLIPAVSSSRQFTGTTGTLYFSASDFARETASLLSGSMQLRATTKGLFISLSSLITRSSASAYSSRGIWLIEPSVVTTRPIVECSLITFCVPISAAILKGISSSNQGVRTIRG